MITGAEIPQFRRRRSVYQPSASTEGHTHTVSLTSGGCSAGHTHQIDVPAYVGSSGASGGGVSIDNRPAHYAMIFIRRCH